MSNPFDIPLSPRRANPAIEIVMRDSGLRVDKIPSPVEARDGEKVYIWLCPEPSCRRCIRLPYRRGQRLPCCMGGPRLHPKQMLVCEIEDIYRECAFRFWEGNEELGRPLIYPRNYMQFPKLRMGEQRRDISTTVERDRR